MKLSTITGIVFMLMFCLANIIVNVPSAQAAIDTTVYTEVYTSGTCKQWEYIDLYQDQDVYSNLHKVQNSTMAVAGNDQFEAELSGWYSGDYNLMMKRGVTSFDTRAHNHTEPLRSAILSGSYWNNRNIPVYFVLAYNLTSHNSNFNMEHKFNQVRYYEPIEANTHCNISLDITKFDGLLGTIFYMGIVGGMDGDGQLPLTAYGGPAKELGIYQPKLTFTFYNVNPNADEDEALFHAIPIMIDLFLIMVPALIAGVFFGKMGMLVGYSLMALINIINDPGFLITGFMIWSSCFILMWGDR